MSDKNVPQSYGLGWDPHPPLRKNSITNPLFYWNASLSNWEPDGKVGFPSQLRSSPTATKTTARAQSEKEFCEAPQNPHKISKEHNGKTMFQQCPVNLYEFLTTKIDFSRLDLVWYFSSQLKPSVGTLPWAPDQPRSAHSYPGRPSSGSLGRWRWSLSGPAFMNTLLGFPRQWMDICRQSSSHPGATLGACWMWLQIAVIT